MVDFQGSLVSKQPLTFHVIVVNGRQGHLADSHRFTSRRCNLRPQGPRAVFKTTIQATYCMHSSHVAYKGSPARSPHRAGLGQLSTQARPALVHAHHVREHSTRPSPFVNFKAGTNPLSRAAYLPRELEHPHRRPAGLLIQRHLLAHLGQDSSSCPRHHTRSSLNALPTFINAQPTYTPPHWARSLRYATRDQLRARSRPSSARHRRRQLQRLQRRRRHLNRQDAARRQLHRPPAAVDIFTGKTPSPIIGKAPPSTTPPASRRRRHLLRLDTG
ncbi:hypothetical protein T492DRAFT_1102595 [Pavlovales sp. CCMP2436]|nr:hypothetical protein T492DRAFT_1102595 [Pavlovales sp. CCMP2436]